MAARRYSNACALLPKKQQSFIQDSLLALSGSHGIDLVKIDLDGPLADQGPSDCVLNKLYGDDWRWQVEDFQLWTPSSSGPLAVPRPLPGHLGLRNVTPDEVPEDTVKAVADECFIKYPLTW